MKRRSVVSLVVLLFTGGVLKAENLVSGPQVGEKVSGSFSVLFLNGDHAGAKRCPVDVKGYDLTALIFARDLSEPLIGLLKKLDRQLDELVLGRIGRWVSELTQAGGDGRPGQAGSVGDESHTAASQGLSFASGPQPAHPFSHERA